MKKVIIQEDTKTYTVLSTDSHAIGTLEEYLHRCGIEVSIRSGVVASLCVYKDQGEGPDALDKENWVQGAVDGLRPSGFSNWETWCVVEHLGNDEDAPHTPTALESYIRTRMAPQAFYEEFAAVPAGDAIIINWGEVAEALRD